MSRATNIVVLVFCISLMTLRAGAENWPGWRGPRGDGTSLDKNVPLEWDPRSGKNIVWKVKLPGSGHASPVIWEDKILLSTCLEDEQQRALVCLDVKTGRELWRTNVLQSPLESRHRLNSFASGTPATDGRLIYVAYLRVGDKKIPAPNVGTPRDITPGNAVLAAFDFAGRRQWMVELGEFISAHGFCSCPVLYRDLVIVNGDHDGKGYLVALNKQTGREAWRVSRLHGIRSYVTPIIRKIDGRDQMVLSGSGHVASFDPATGDLIWKVEGPTEQFVASMVFDGSRFFVAAGFPTHHVMAIRPDGRGDVTNTHVAWHVDRYVRCYVPSPVLIGQQLFVADDRGTASSFDSTNGERIWQGRMGRAFSASLVATERAAYFLADDGTMKVVRPGPRLEVIAENKLDEFCCASPAISNGQLYIRGAEHLFRIGASAAGGAE